MHEEHKRYVNNDKMRADVLEKDATRCINCVAHDAAEFNEEKLNDMEKEVKVISESSKFLSFCEIIKRLSPHRHLLKDRMRDKTVS